MKAIALSLMLSIYIGQAHAEPKAGDKAKAAKKVFVSFDEDLVKGSMTGAELFLILQKKQTKFEHLFDLKEDFTPEMIRDAEGVE